VDGRFGLVTVGYVLGKDMGIDWIGMRGGLMGLIRGILLVRVQIVCPPLLDHPTELRPKYNHELSNKSTSTQP
jgi:hypothetical protein